MKPDFTMQDARFGALIAFAAVSEERSFTRAARRLHVSPSAVSQAVRRLEARVGAALLVRTSRRVQVTEAGARLLARALPALGELASTFELAAAEANAVTGTLRITAPSLASLILPPILERFLRAHPAARVEVSVSDRLVDLVADGFDVGIRLEEALPPAMVAVRITAPFRFVVCAAPRYLAAHGTPRTFRELARHVCIGIRLPTAETIYKWELERRGRTLRLDVPSRLVVDGMRFAAHAAKAGLGLAYVDEPWIADDLARGALRIVVPGLAAHASGLFLYFPPAARRSPRVRAFLEAARDALGASATRG
ncbi:MAG: LysR family transcriptional regulator [Deltaproteobacteria bacterium]|nr:LysR family transcriptional regulator [Deltaproteobacteria bacterium]